MSRSGRLSRIGMRKHEKSDELSRFSERLHVDLDENIDFTKSSAIVCEPYFYLEPGFVPCMKLDVMGQQGQRRGKAWMIILDS
eukprot:4110743-Pleurochrysis_carterae.AAC.1